VKSHSFSNSQPRRGTILVKNPIFSRSPPQDSPSWSSLLVVGEPKHLLAGRVMREFRLHERNLVGSQHEDQYNEYSVSRCDSDAAVHRK
jgi:hypothetical protein